MTWYHYAARSNEIFCDLDSPWQSQRARSVLSAAYREKKLEVAEIWSMQSASHAHLVVILNKKMNASMRATWACFMGSDRYRMIFTIARISNGVRSPDVLISREPWEFRRADAVCQCVRKHDHMGSIKDCPAMKKLRGVARLADYFPHTKPRQAFPWGRVPKSLLK